MAIDPAISAAAALAIALLFGASAVHKARSFGDFVEVLRGYRLTPGFAAPAIGIGVIAAEAVIAASLVAPSTRAIGGVGGALMLTVYAAAIMINIARGRSEIDCGCSFGGRAGRLSTALPVRNGVLVLAAVVALFPTTGRALTVLDLMTIGFFVATAAAFYLAFETIRANAARFEMMGHA